MMALTETAPQERAQTRRRPFATLVKKLRNFKGSYSNDDSNGGSTKREKTLAKKRPSKNNNPYPESGRVGNGTSRAPQQSDAPSISTSATSLGRTLSLSSTTDGRGRAPTAGGRSMAPTISTADHEVAHSIAAPSHGASSVAGTSRTANGGLDSRRGGDSTFSSPAPSVRSLTTTLTTIQSMPMGLGAHTAHTPHGQHSSSTNGHQHHSIHFNQPFPSTPASAIPAHLTPASTTAAGQSGHPTTYTTATANGLLTDNASILTLASSSKRRRRRSLDTDASVRALAPSSLFGGSRESLPLSVLSATVDSATGPSSSGVPPVPTTPSAGTSRIVAERASIYSVSGMTSERNSLYATKQPSLLSQDKSVAGAADAASIRSGRIGHSRAESINGSLGVASPLTSPKEDPGGEEDEQKEEAKKQSGEKANVKE